MKRLIVVVAIAAISAAMAVGHGVTTRPVLADDQLYFYLAERCASGVPPHLSQYEVKTQLPTLLGGAAIATGRRVAAMLASTTASDGEAALTDEAGPLPNARDAVTASVDVLSERALTVTFAALAIVLAWLLTLELTASEGAALVSIAAMFSIYGLFLEASTGFQPKIFMLTFLLAAHLACARRRPLATGVAGMAAFLCWQPAALAVGGCAVAMLLDRRATWKSLLTAAAGALLVLGCYEAWFAWHGALGEQIRQELLLASASRTKPFDVMESLWFVLTESQTFRLRANGLPSVFAAATVLLWIGMLAAPRRAMETLRERPGLVAFWTAAHLTTAFTLYDHQAHPDMLLIQPYFAVACGIAAAWVTGLLRRAPGGRVLVAAAVVVFVGLGLKDAHDDVGRAWAGRKGFEKEVELARLTDLYFEHWKDVWVIGSVHLLAIEHRDNWLPVGNVGRETSDRDMTRWRPLRDGVMPQIIIAGRGLRPGYKAWLPVEYLDITPRAFAMDRIRVYARVGSEHPGFTRTTAPRAAPAPSSRVPVRKPPPLQSPNSKPEAAPAKGA